MHLLNSHIARLAGALACLVPFRWSCHLAQEATAAAPVTFDKLSAALMQYESVVNLVNDKNGAFLDTVYRGKVDTVGEIKNLKVEGWDGGQVRIVIIGYKDNAVAYKLEKHFNGAGDKTDTTLVIVTQATAIQSLVRDLPMTEGDTLSLPIIEVVPATLADRSVSWSSSDPAVLQIVAGYLKAHKRGQSILTVRLNAEKSRTLDIKVTVYPNPRIAESLDLSPDTLRLTANGAVKKVAVKALPSSADQSVSWRMEDSSIALVSEDATARGLKPGSTKAWAVSMVNPSAIDSIRIEVSEPVVVTRVRFPKNPLTLYVGGAAESLFVEVLPAEASQEADFSVIGPAYVEIKDLKVSAKATGITRILGRSKANPEKTDTLDITVLTGSPVSSLVLNPKPAGPAYTGGDNVALTASILPAAAPQQVQWKSGNPGIASVDESGYVVGLSPGIARIYATSASDISKKDSVDIQVKRDIPVLSVGQDTTVSLGATVVFRPTAKKENGKILKFKWDLDGDLTWDDSADVVKDVSRKYDQEKETAARFHVRDNQGNETLVVKKVKAVNGPVVLILSPLNNSFVRTSPIKVAWSVNGVAQDTLPLEHLEAGPNVLTRSSKDVAGTVFSSTVTVNFDTLPPSKPLVHGNALVNSSLPNWTWAPGSGGAGYFRVGLDAESFTSPETKDTVFTPAADLKEGTHTLFVQERDAAGNWSASGRLALRVDLTAPNAPVVNAPVPANTNNRKPKFTWSSGGGKAGFQYRMDNPDLTTAAISTTDSAFTPSSDLLPGAHTLYVRESDSAGNWSKAGSAQVTIDTLPPGAPKVNGSAVTNTNPKWTWTTGGNGGSGDYRWKQDNADLTTGAATGRDTTFTASAFVNGGTYVLYVQERDGAGNWSANGSFTIKVNTSGPPSPIISVNPASPTNNKSPKWTWKSGGGGNGSFQYRLDNPDVTAGTVTTDTTVTLLLSNGSHTLFVRERDAVGNWGSVGSGIILIDTIAGTSPNFNATPASPTKDPRPIWSWNPGVGGKGWYRAKVGDENWATGATVGASTTFQPTGDLAEGNRTLYVQEQDDAGNWSASASRTLTLDFTPPGKPVMNIVVPISPVNSLTPTWSWTSGGNGNGNFRVKVNNSDLNSGSTPVNSPAKIFSPGSALAEGENTLYVQEQDAAGNWSASGSRTLYCVKAGQMGGLVSGNSHEQEGLQITVTPSATPFVWTRGATDEVKSFTGSSWANTNHAGSSDRGGVLLLNPKTNQPAFQVGSLVSNYSGSGWSDMPALPESNASGMSYNKLGDPLVAYYSFDEGTDYPPYSVIVSKWNTGSGGYWYREFPALTPEFTTSFDRCYLYMDTEANIPYVHMKSTYRTVNLEIHAYKNSAWSKLGSNGFPEVNYLNVKVGVNKNGKVYAVTSDSPEGLTTKLSVYQYDGSSTWSPVVAKFPFSGVLETKGYAMAFNSNGDPVVAFGEAGKVSVYAYDGAGKWLKMGTANIVDGATDISLAIGPQDIAYVAVGGNVYVTKLGFDP